MLGPKSISDKFGLIDKKQEPHATVKWSGPPRGLVEGELVKPTEITSSIGLDLT